MMRMLFSFAHIRVLRSEGKGRSGLYASVDQPALTVWLNRYLKSA